MLGKLRALAKKIITKVVPQQSAVQQPSSIGSEMENELYLTDVIREMDKLPCAHPASVNQDVANTYFALTKMWRPLLIVEIGCFIGFSTQHFAEALRHQGFGKIISIDAFDWSVETKRGIENRHDVAEYYRHKAGLEGIITFIKGYSTEVYSQLASQLHQQIDLLYIDGDHSVTGAFADFNTYYNDLRVGGHLILHDIYPSMCSVDGPRVLIDTLRIQGFAPRCMETIEMNTRDGFGIGILRKTSEEHIYLDVSSIDLSDTTNASYPIRINVTNARTGQPIVGALLECPQRFNEQRISNTAGYLELEHYIPNRYLFNITATGYVTKKNLLVDLAYGAQHLTITLEPLA